MSIVGAQSVSMGDLIKLGPQALTAMAQGQMPTIAPSYMVIAALKALTDQQAGMQQPQPQGTVKDQVVAQATPPAQAGIGAMQPVKGFAEGGEVEGSWIDRLPPEAGLRSIIEYFKNPRRRPILDELFSSKEDEPKLPYTKPTRPSIPFVDIPEVAIEGESPRQAVPAVDRDRGVGVRASMGATSSRTGGIGATKDPLSKYREMKEAPGPEAFNLNIPKNQQLEEAYAKYRNPNEARMKELRNAEENAGLAAFARGMVDPKRGRGFGAVFGPAAADYVEAKESKAEKRRDYEDKREAMADQIGIQLGEQARKDYLDNTRFKFDRSDKVLEQEFKKTELANQAIRAQNQEVLDRERMQIQREANAIQAAIRRDGIDRQKFERLLAIKQQAEKTSLEQATDIVTKDVTLTGLPPDEKQRRIMFLGRELYGKMIPPNLEAVIMQGLGVPAEAGAQGAGRVYRGTMTK